ncbi:flavodoxin [Companilactobacillus versmoldensis]|uniref:Flavodoxin n=1 Tax=Companilactobacillus versmoldensis DSM 14857 = KCTC 3814 TaxID=1423815 RepID=A0A0R1SNW5_9LACO|nr:flavodoxin [Companilactobacillus versmoldensis]KRL68210.1 flavodoxin [Companilactobacillus versmoldensis DSM 14857 = KCTC 3814]
MANALIVYATITGNNQMMADILADQLDKLGLEVTETEMSQTDPEDFLDYDVAIVCVYTYDEGALPEEGMDFYEDLGDTDLSGKYYTVLGSGDTYYGKFYNVAVDKFAAQFELTGAKLITNCLKIELEPDEYDIMNIAKVAENISNKF